MAAAFRIREATPMDAEGIAEVHVETWRSTYAGIIPDAYLVGQSKDHKSASWRESIARQKRSKTLVAVLPDHRVVGFGDCGPSRHRELPYSGEVYSLYVAPDWQDQGMGRALLTALFDELSSKGAVSAFLWVLSRNPTRFFYEAMGGESVAERQEHFAGALLDETAYAWPDLPAWLVTARR